MKLAKSPAGPASKAASTAPPPDRQSVLLLIHLQNDFCPGGAMPVPGGDHVIPVANAWIRLFAGQGYGVVATRDWHPPNHCSFRDRGGPHPSHCVQGSFGAQFHPDLTMPPGTLIVSGVTHPDRETHSGFDGTMLDERLEDMGARTVYVVGLATDTCVRHTVLEACRRGFRVVVVGDGVRGMNTEPGDADRALAAMREAGAVVARSSACGVRV